jgi:hypothetical protein
MPTIYRAEIDTRHFHFEAYGNDAEEARENLLRGLNKHATQTNLPPTWGESIIGEARVLPFVLGACYRDREAI